MKSTAWKGLVIENNTIVNSGNITSADGAPIEGFSFRNNIVFENQCGFKGDNTASGVATIDKYFPNSSISGNAIIGGKAERYRGDNVFPLLYRSLESILLSCLLRQVAETFAMRGRIKV